MLLLSKESPENSLILVSRYVRLIPLIFITSFLDGATCIFILKTIACLFVCMLISCECWQCFRGYRNKVATTKFIPWPIEIRFCEPSNATNQTETPPRSGITYSRIHSLFVQPVVRLWYVLHFAWKCGSSFVCKMPHATSELLLIWSCDSLRYWFKAKGKLSDDQALHR